MSATEHMSIVQASAGTTRPLRVCLFTTEFPPEVTTGGIGAHTEALAAGLTSLGHQVHVVTPTSSKARAVEVREGFAIVREPRPHGSGMRGSLLFSRTMSEALARLDRVHTFDVIEAPEYAAATAFLPRRPGRLTVVRLHIGARLISRFRRALPRERLRAAFSNHLEQRAIARADLITAPSQVIADEEAPGCAVSVIPNAVAFTAKPADLTHRPSTIVFAGRLELRKRPHIVAEAAELVLRARPDAQFIFVGPDTSIGFRRRSMRALCAEIIPAELRDRVDFRDAIDRRGIHSLLSGAAVLAVPSAFESFGIVYVEAMLAGAIPIGCRGTAAAEVIDPDRTGLLVDLDDVPGLARAILTVIDNNARRVRLAHAARRAAVEHFTGTAVARAHEAVYRARLAEIRATA